ncbi:MAG: rhodanese-like domain-containing protein [Candidatus Limnocylindrales bacterium]|jgi:rhodanese-related sulfurtransferase
MDRPPTIERITVTEAARRLDAPPAPDGGEARRPLLVDVREPDEFADFRATRAVLMPLSVFQLRYSTLPHDRPLLLICQTGARSLAAAGFLLEHGYADAANVEGGSMAWAAAGLPIRTGPPDDGEGDLPG